VGCFGAGRTSMRRRRPAWALAFAAVALFVPLRLAADEPFKETFSKTYALTKGGVVSLSNVNGDVRVQTWDQATVKVEATKEVSSHELLAQLEIEVEASEGGVRIRTRYPDRSHRQAGHSHMSVAYVLTVPHEATLDEIELVNGSLEVNGLVGGLMAKTVNGAIRAAGASGRTRVETVNGEISLQRERLGAADSVTAKSVNGRIDIRLGAGAAAKVRFETVSGQLSNDFGIPVDKHRLVGSSLTGRIGEGGAEISAETVNGSISLRKI
jgi:hypothetical protein